MIQIIPEIRKQKFSDRLMSGLQNFSQSASTEIPKFFGDRIQKEKQRSVYKELGLPEEVSEFPESLQKELIQQVMGKKAQKQEATHAAIRSISDMRDIISKGNTGLNFLNMLTEEGRGDRAALDTAALNLERLAADMVGKGTLSQQRFKFLKDRLPSGFKTDAENSAILDEWEKILADSEGSGVSTEKKAKTKFNPKHPEHQAKARQLFKTHKDKAKVRKELEREFEF